jgi:hypothetical protein
MKKLNRLALTASMLSVLLCVSGCTDYQSNGVTHSSSERFERICIDGVEYLTRQMGHRGFMSAHFKPDGSLYTCST